MIDYNVEFNKGVLFVRLCGVLNNLNYKDVEEDVFEIIKDGGIKYLVFNVDDLDLEDDVDLFKNCDRLVKENNGRMLLCGNSEMYAGNFEFTSDELSALKILSVC